MIYPYSKVNGVWSIPDSHLELAFYKMVRDKTLKIVFWDGKVKTKNEFIMYMQTDGNFPLFIYDKSELIGFAWLNSIGQNFAFAHFCMFYENWGKDKSKIIDDVFGYWRSFDLFDVILGIIPATNKKAISFLSKAGFVKLGAIPNIINNIYYGKKMPAMIAYRCLR